MAVEDLHVPSRPIRVLTAAALFDGHDAAINIMRRILQSQGAEVIHLGHNRSVDEVAVAAVQEDVDAIAISSYQGGHVEFFEYLVQTLAERGAGHIRVYGGGGGTIVPDEIDYLHSVGVAQIFAPEDGQRLGLAAMVNLILAESDRPREPDRRRRTPVLSGDMPALAHVITAVEAGAADDEIRRAVPTPRRLLPFSGSRDHRHGRGRQILPHRRADPPAAARPDRQAAHRRTGHRSRADVAAAAPCSVTGSG